MSGHLGPLAAALVDDQLTGSVRSRALRHVADCESCRFEVAQQRSMKARLDGLGEPALPSSLFDRLQAMRPLDAGLPPAPTGFPPAGSPGTGLVPVEPLSADPRPRLPSPASGELPGPGAFGLGTTARPWSTFGGPVGRQRVRRVLVGATSVVLLGGGAAYAAGGQHSSPAPVRPVVDVYTVQHGTPGGSIPTQDPTATAVTVGLGH